MGWGDTKAFLEKVVAWPVDETGYVNLHFSIIDKDGGKDIVTGKPFTSMDKMLSFADWAKAQPNFKEMWYCTSLQSEAGENRNGKPKAIRLHQNAKALKAIWIDIDVKDDPKHYGSLEEAWEAFTIFRREAGLPPPSAIVKSGASVTPLLATKTTSAQKFSFNPSDTGNCGDPPNAYTPFGPSTPFAKACSGALSTPFEK